VRKILLGLAIGVTCITAALSAIGSVRPGTERAGGQTWSVGGGEVGVRWNRDLASDIGIQIAPPIAAFADNDQRGHERFAVRLSDSLQFRVDKGHLKGFEHGSLRAEGGYVLQLRDGNIDLTNFRLVPTPLNPLHLDVVGSDGQAWFYVDHLMYEMADAGRTFAVRTMDMRISPRLAARLNQPLAADLAIADLELTGNVLAGGLVQAPDGTCNTDNGANCNWAGTAAPNGGTYRADLFMESFTPQYSRCQSCSGAAGSGKVVFTPSSSLKNNVNAGSVQTTVGGQGSLGASSAIWAADIPWFEKFSGPNQPYGNDQHPFLIWNMYRIDANGRIRQIARSGVKHAFVTINSGADCPYPFSHVLGRGCEDTYATGNNDSSTDLGPRREIIPATNQWGRCGSIYDPGCTGSYHNPGNGNFDQRLMADESQLSTDNNPGSHWLFESWYLAREDINIYNSMGTVDTTQHWSGSIWGISASNYKLGSAIDRWVDPSAPGANAMNTELATSEGHAKVAVKVTDLGGGKWRYNYAVMNFDFARAQTQGAEPNLRVVSNKGFDAFKVPVPSGVKILSPAADVGDSNPNLNWTVDVRGGFVNWSTDTSVAGIGDGTHTFPAQLPTLDWGTLYSFSFISNAAPVAGTGTLHVALAGSPATYGVATLVPAGSSH